MNARDSFVKAMRELNEREQRAVSGFLSGGGGFAPLRRVVEAFARQRYENRCFEDCFERHLAEETAQLLQDVFEESQ